MAQRGLKLIERIAFLFDVRFQQIAIFLHENGRNVGANLNENGRNIGENLHENGRNVRAPGFPLAFCRGIW